MGVLEGGRRAAQGSVCTWLTCVACPRPGVLLCLRVRAARVASCPWSAMSAPQRERAQRTHPGPRRRVHRLALRKPSVASHDSRHTRRTFSDDCDVYLFSRVCVCLASERAPTTPFTCVESVLASGQRSARSRMGVLFLACLVAVQFEAFIYRERVRTRQLIVQRVAIGKSACRPAAAAAGEEGPPPWRRWSTREPVEES